MRRAAALLATASVVALLAAMPTAAASDCAGATGVPPADVATPTMLYETLRTRTNAQLLAIGFQRKPVARECAWIYEVKMLTASGSVVELDFAATSLDLVGARGPDNDRDAAALVRGFGGDAAFLRAGPRARGPDSGTSSGNGTGGGSGSDDDGDSNSGSGGEGGNSGSGSANSGSGSSGSGGGDSGGDSGGEGGEGGGDSDGGGEGGEGGDD